MTDNLSSGPSEAAVEAARKMSRAGEVRGHSANARGHDALIAAHCLSLGTARSVNEAWCRADERARITTALRIASPTVTGLSPATAVRLAEWIDQLAREFGGRSDAE